MLAPTLSSLTPTSVAAGGVDFTLTATGTNFAQGTTILWDGITLPTTVSSSTQLTAKVTAAEIASARTVSIRVMKSDSTTSGTLSLTITGGTGGGSFTLTSISPSAVAAGSGDFTLTANGTGFVSGAAITLNGTAVSTTFDSATQLHATVPAADVAAAGTITVGVTNPDKSTTNTLSLTVISGRPWSRADADLDQSQHRAVWGHVALDADRDGDELCQRQHGDVERRGDDDHVRIEHPTDRDDSGQ